MKSDLELFKLYEPDGTYYNNTASNTFSWLQNTISNNAIMMLDVEAARAVANDIFDFLIKKQRFMNLVTLSRNELKYYKDEGFKLSGHVFSSLDEVEKALKNKIFL